LTTVLNGVLVVIYSVVSNEDPSASTF